MTLDFAREAVKQVRKFAGEGTDYLPDDVMAHRAEKSLWEHALAAIATGNTEDPRGLAAEVLRTREIEFGRWYE